MSDSPAPPGPRHAGPPASGGKARAAGRWFAEATGDAVGELVLIGAGCLFLVSTLWALRWGWSRNPAGTSLIIACLVAVMVYAVVAFVTSRRGAAAPRTRWASAAIGFTLTLVVLVVYGTAYCSCL